MQQVMKHRTAIIAVALLLIIVALAFASKPAAQKTVEEDSAATSRSNGNVELAPKIDSALLDNAPLPEDFVMGDMDAPVTLIEYASLSCPHCAAFHNEVLPAITEKYIDTKKLRYILRPYPLNESAFAGAMLVSCVGEKGGPGRYYTFNRVLFDAQKKWAFDANFKDSLKTFAEVGGVNADVFNACMNDIDLEKRLLEARKAASGELHVDSTPSFFLNGHPHKGNKSLEAISAEIDLLLEQAAKK